MDDTAKKRNQWLLRLTDRQDQILRDYMAEQGAEEKAWFIQACIAYTMAHCPKGGLAAEVDALREGTLAPPVR